MKLNSLLILVLALGAVSAGVYFLNRPKPVPPSDTRVGQPLVDAATVEKAAGVKVSDQGKTVELTKQPDGTWRVVSYHGLPADFPKLSTFIGELTAAKIEQFVSASADRISRLEFKDTRLALLDSSGKELWTVTLGKSADAGGRFFRFGEEPKAYRTDLRAWFDTESKNWADSALLTFKSEDIAKIEIAFPDAAPVIASRAKKEDAFAAENAPAGQKLKTDKITSLLGTFGSVRFSDTSDLTDANAVAAKENARTVKLTTFDGKTVSLTLGRKPEQKITKPAANASPAPSTPSSLTAGTPAPSTPPADAKPVEETIPAGPVFINIAHSDASAAVNALMPKRAFQVYEHFFTSLPAKPEELFEPAPATVPAPVPATLSPAAPATPPPSGAP